MLQRRQLVGTCDETLPVGGILLGCWWIGGFSRGLCLGLGGGISWCIGGWLGAWRAVDILWPVTDTNGGVEQSSGCAVLLGSGVAVCAHVELVALALYWVDAIGTSCSGVLFEV